MIEANIKKILLEISNSNTKLICVSKTVSVEKIMEAYNTGVRDFGENKVQELLSKIDKLPRDIRWHMIGHLQSNKVKDIIGKVVLIHSVDSIKLAYIINKEAKKKGVCVKVLLEVNIASEESKFGFKINELKDAINYIRTLDNVSIRGFMCVAPITSNEEDNRKYFRQMCKLKDEYGYDILSMGMSNDYLVAVQEKSTYIRIGTKIFGSRK